MPNLNRIDFSNPPMSAFASPDAQKNLIQQVAEPFKIAPDSFGRLGMTGYELPVQIMWELNCLVQNYKATGFVVF